MVYGSGLENQRVLTGTVGSNPTLSVQKAQSMTGFFSVYKGFQKVKEELAKFPCDCGLNLQRCP